MLKAVVKIYFLMCHGLPSKQLKMMDKVLAAEQVHLHNLNG